MKKLLVLMVLAGSGALFACKDTEGDDDSDDVDGKPDAATSNDAAAKPDATSTADSSAPPSVKIENVGAACTNNGDCKGANASCEKELVTGGDPVELKGGYCTAVCASSAECGPDGACPAIEVTMGFNLGGANPLSGILPSYCLDKCERGSTCRDGYECKSIGDFIPADIKNGPFGLFLRGAAFSQPYCMPPIDLNLPGGMTPQPDAGSMSMPDAGMTATLVGGIDAGG